MKSGMTEQEARDKINENIRNIPGATKEDKDAYYKNITDILNGNPKNLKVIVEDLIEVAISNGNGKMMVAILACKHVKDKDPSVIGQTKGFLKDLRKDLIKGGGELVKDLTGREIQTKSDTVVELDLTGILKILEKEKITPDVIKVIKESGKLWEQQPENQRTNKVVQAVKATAVAVSDTISSVVNTAVKVAPPVVAQKVIPIEVRLVSAIENGDVAGINKIFAEGVEIKLKENPFKTAMKSELGEDKLKLVVGALLENEDMKKQYFMSALNEQLATKAYQPNIPFIKACFFSANFTKEKVFDLLTKLEDKYSTVTDGITFEKIAQHIELKQEVLAAIISSLDPQIRNEVIKPLLDRAVMDWGNRGQSKYIDAIISALPSNQRKEMMEYTLKLAVEKKKPQAAKAVLTSAFVTDKERTELLKIQHNGQPLSKWIDSGLATTKSVDNKKAYEDLSGMLKSAKRYDKLENAAYKIMKLKDNKSVKEKYGQSTVLAMNIGGQLVASESKLLQSIGRRVEKIAVKAFIAKTPEWEAIKENYASAKIATRDVYKEVADSISLTKDDGEIKINNVAIQVKSNVAMSLYMEINKKLGEKSTSGPVVMQYDQSNNYKEVEKLIAKALQTNNSSEETKLLTEAKNLAFKDVRAQYKERLGETAITAPQTTQSR